MTVEEALVVVDAALKQEHLSTAQELVFCQAWQGRTYIQMAQSAGYSPEYIKDVGYRLWQLLSQALGEKVTKNNFHSVLRLHAQLTQALTAPLNTKEQSTQTDKSKAAPNFVDSRPVTANKRQDWGEAIDVSAFYGRTEELAVLEQWIAKERCRLVALLGMGGIGKTTLSVKLAEQLQDQFEYVIWRSLRNAPPIEDILADLLQFLSNHQATNLPKTLDSQISRLMQHLRSSRCLVVLDNAESILRSGNCAGYYREGYEGYSVLLRYVEEVPHQSCLVLTSREKPRELASLEGETSPVRSLKLTGLKEKEARKIFQAKGSFSGSEDEWRTLIEHYGRNPLVLKMVASSTQYFFSGSISKVVELLKQGTLVFDDIRDVLEQQFNRLSELEKAIMNWLAINREPVSFEELESDFVPRISQSKLLENLASLERRSLIEKNSIRFTQQPMVMEYMTERLTEKVHREVTTEEVKLLMNSLALPDSCRRSSVGGCY